METAATRFKKRMTYWTAQGFSGTELYQKLANDPDAPDQFTTRDLAEILGVKVPAIQKRRFRGEKPDFVRVSGRHVFYLRSDVCGFIANRFVRQREGAL
jgi:hypothetical protein